MEEQNFSEECFLTTVEQHVVKDEKFILCIISSEAVQEAIHHCLYTTEIKFYYEDHHTSRIVAQILTSGMAFICVEATCM
jgi:hypothetical protein